MSHKQQAGTDWDIHDVYNLLMAEIEPELLPKNYALLDKKYADEQPEQRKKRYAHYADCFELLLERLNILMDTLQSHVRSTYNNLIKQLENQSNDTEQEFLESFDAFLQAE